MNDSAIHFVRVTTDDRSYRLWAAATAREEAVDHVLDRVPEGWCAALIDAILPEVDFPQFRDALSIVARGEVRELDAAGWF